jgi:hypothetical protein
MIFLPGDPMQDNKPNQCKLATGLEIASVIQIGKSYHDKLMVYNSNVY